jgi:hypothetical protein
MQIKEVINHGDALSECWNPECTVGECVTIAPPGCLVTQIRSPWRSEKPHVWIKFHVGLGWCMHRPNGEDLSPQGTFLQLGCWVF